MYVSHTDPVLSQNYENKKKWMNEKIKIQRMIKFGKMNFAKITFLSFIGIVLGGVSWLIIRTIPCLIDGTLCSPTITKRKWVMVVANFLRIGFVVASVLMIILFNNHETDTLFILSLAFFATIIILTSLEIMYKVRKFCSYEIENISFETPPIFEISERN